VVDLVAPGVVNTMPESTLRAVADHGQVPADSIREHYDEAQQFLDELKAVGVDYDDVTATLEANAIDIFDASWQTASEQVATALRQQPTRREDAE
jgi:transaldolase